MCCHTTFVVRQHISLWSETYINPETVAGDVPYIGSYSEMSKRYVETNMDESQEDHLLQYASADALKNLLKDKTYIKYVSALVNYARRDLEAAGYADIIIKEWNSLRINTDKLDCDYYHLINGDASYFHQYHNEYMKEYSWAEETNSEILHYSSM